MATKEFIWPVRVYYEDTDAGGVVYYANYLKFMERARTEWLRNLGYEQDELLQQGIVFAVRHVEIDYLGPARFNDALEVKSSLSEVGRVGVTFKQSIHRIDTPTTDLSRASIKVACLDAAGFRPRAIPEAMKEDFLSVY